jgi:hypothetical protein
MIRAYKAAAKAAGLSKKEHAIAVPELRKGLRVAENVVARGDVVILELQRGVVELLILDVGGVALPPISSGVAGLADAVKTQKQLDGQIYTSVLSIVAVAAAM